MSMKKLLISGLLIWLILSSGVGATEVFPLDQVVPGMKGYGKTVVQGAKVEEFDFEVLDIIPQTPPIPSLIMIEVSGDLIERSDGIASGMSGSPVYLDGKLLGAIGYGYSYTNHRIGLVTPAESMMELINEVSDMDELPLPKDFEPLATPMLLGGFQNRAAKILEKQFAPHNLQVIPGLTGNSGSFENIMLEPGSAFGVQLLRGDFQVVAFGTITAITETGSFVGFGHPFLHKGKVNYFVAPAFVHYTMPHLEIPYKIASVGPSVGTLLLDRSSGVAGLLGKQTPYIPINIQVHDLTENRLREFKVEAVTDDSLLSALAISSVYQGIDSTLDRIGKGTAYVRLEFHSNDLLKPIIRENMFYSDSDIAVWALSDLNEGLELLIANDLQDVTLSGINTKITIEEVRKTASIEKAIPTSFQVRAGESVDIEVLIRPYRQPVEYRVLRITIPEETLPGYMTVTVRGGGMGYYASKPTVHTTWQSFEAEDDEMPWQSLSGAESLDKLLEDYMLREQNNEIVAEFYPYIDSYSSNDIVEEVVETLAQNGNSIPISELVLLEPEYGGYHWEDLGSEGVRVRLTTQFVIEGSASFDIEVIK